MTSPAWYLKRLAAMGPVEIAARAKARALDEVWRRREPPDPTRAVRRERSAPRALPLAVAGELGANERAVLLAAADRLLAGRGEFFGEPRTDLIAPDWGLDPVSGRRASLELYAAGVPYRDESAVGNIKQIWEPSRHQYLTTLAAAWAVSGEHRYAERVSEHLDSWWAANAPRRGVHWISGIELGIRLISWVWVRRLLEDWPGVSKLFEDNDLAVAQIYHHQRWLAARPSVGSSANNHVIAEAAGLVVGACGFDWFEESPKWRTKGATLLAAELERNTFPSGLNRELATEYHGLVLELGLAALAELDAADTPVPDAIPNTVARMGDALAAIVDDHLHPPRQGDADDGYGLVLDPLVVGDPARWAALLETTGAVFGRSEWWPPAESGDLRTRALCALIRPRPTTAGRPGQRPPHLADAGLTVLRAGEVWCRCDGGPHGFLSIAAHAHADALSVEVRVDGVDVLADPGTYCYHGQPQWRSYFRSTHGHNTLELGGVDSSESGGPFLWTKHARSRVLAAHQSPGGAGYWSGEHDGYLRRLGARHRRDVALDPQAGTLTITDTVHAPEAHPARLAFHCGPAVAVELDGTTASLSWADRTAVLQLPDALAWSVHRGQEDPPLGWYSPGFGRKVPSVTLLGTGRLGGPNATPSITEFRYLDGN